MPQDESGPQRKLSRPWHGPYRIVSISDPDVLLTMVYFPQDRTIQVHQSRVKASTKVPGSVLLVWGMTPWCKHLQTLERQTSPLESQRPPQIVVWIQRIQLTKLQTVPLTRRQHPHRWIRTPFNRRHRTIARLRTVPRGLHVSTPYGTDILDELDHRGSDVTGTQRLLLYVTVCIVCSHLMRMRRSNLPVYVVT